MGILCFPHYTAYSGEVCAKSAVGVILARQSEYHPGYPVVLGMVLACVLALSNTVVGVQHAFWLDAWLWV